MGYSPWGCKELDMTERLSTHTHKFIHTHTHTYTLPYVKYIMGSSCIEQGIQFGAL